MIAQSQLPPRVKVTCPFGHTTRTRPAGWQHAQHEADDLSERFAGAAYAGLTKGAFSEITAQRATALAILSLRCELAAQRLGGAL
jgi:hypothetical protein